MNLLPLLSPMNPRGQEKVCLGETLATLGRLWPVLTITPGRLLCMHGECEGFQEISLGMENQQPVSPQAGFGGLCCCRQSTVTEVCGVWGGRAWSHERNTWAPDGGKSQGCFVAFACSYISGWNFGWLYQASKAERKNHVERDRRFDRKQGLGASWLFAMNLTHEEEQRSFLVTIRLSSNCLGRPAERKVARPPPWTNP